MATPCTVHRVQLDQLPGAAADPALAALLAEGWTVVGSVVMNDKAAPDYAGPVLHIILAPPRPAQADRWWLPAVAVAVVAAVAMAAAILAAP